MRFWIAIIVGFILVSPLATAKIYMIEHDTGGDGGGPTSFDDYTQYSWLDVTIISVSPAITNVSTAPANTYWVNMT